MSKPKAATPKNRKTPPPSKTSPPIVAKSESEGTTGQGVSEQPKGSSAANVEFGGDSEPPGRSRRS